MIILTFPLNTHILNPVRTFPEARGWISEYLRIQAKLLPGIQVDKACLEHELSAQEFGQSLSQTLKPLSKGVVCWSWKRVAADSEKKEIIRKFCAQ